MFNIRPSSESVQSPAIILNIFSSNLLMPLLSALCLQQCQKQVVACVAMCECIYHQLEIVMEIKFDHCGEKMIVVNFVMLQEHLAVLLFHLSQFQ